MTSPQAPREPDGFSGPFATFAGCAWSAMITVLAAGIGIKMVMDGGKSGYFVFPLPIACLIAMILLTRLRKGWRPYFSGILLGFFVVVAVLALIWIWFAISYKPWGNVPG